MAIPLLPNDITYESQLRSDSPAYLADYQQVQGIPVLPITALLEMALAAAREALGPGHYQIEEVEFHHVLLLPEATTRTLRVNLTPTSSDAVSFHILSLPLDAVTGEQDTWVPCAAGRICPAPAAPEDEPEHISSVSTKTPRGRPGTQFSLFYFGSSEAAYTPDRYRLLLDGAQFADRHGYAAVWTPERHFHSFGGSYPAPAILSSALATITERVHLRAGSVVLPLHHPLRVAEEWSVVDNLSRGRVGLSFATGWAADDFVLAPGNYDNRKEILFESLRLFQRFWRGEEVLLENGSGKTAAVTLFPRPQQRELPTWLTIVKNPEMYVKAGELGVNVLTNLLGQTTEELSRNIQLYRDARARHGHDPEAGQVTLLVHTFVGEDLGRVRQTVRGPFCDYLKSTVGVIQNLVKSLDLKLNLDELTPKDIDDLLAFAFERYFQTSALLGTPATVREMIARLTAIGVDEIACFIDFGVEYSSVMESLSLLNQVRAAVAGSAGGGAAARDGSALSHARVRCREKLSGAEHYRRLREGGSTYGPSFRGVQAVWRGEGEAIGQLLLPPALQEEAELYHIHPAFLDAGLQVLTTLLPRDEHGDDAARSYLPVGVETLRVFARPGPNAWATARVREGASAGAPTIIGDVRLLNEDGHVLAELLGLRLDLFGRTTPAPERASVGDLLYEVRWQQKEWPPVGERRERFPPHAPGKWLIFEDGAGVGKRLSEMLTARGEVCLRVATGADYAVSGERYQINPERPEDYQKLVRDTLRATPQRWRGIVHLWGVDATPSDATTLRSLAAAHLLGSESVLHLLQGLAEGGWSESPRLWLVTGGSQQVGATPSPVAVAHAPLWGMGRAVAGEHPELQCRTIDLDPEDVLAQAPYIFEEVWFEDGEDQVAIRGRRRHVPRLVRFLISPRPEATTGDSAEQTHDASQPPAVAPAPHDQIVAGATQARAAAAAPAVGESRAGAKDADRAALNEGAHLFGPESTYLITGGFGVLGLILARHLVGRGVRHLALMGRSGPGLEAGTVLDELRAAGAEICEIKGDVAQEADVVKALSCIHGTMPPLRGVFHAAMWIEDAVLLQLTRERFAAAMRPKVDGAWNLHTHTRDLPLDFFVLFSSAASLLGSVGQGNYVAANAFLDALAHYRRFLGLPALTIDWGQWAETHLQSRRGLVDRLALIGMRPLPPPQGLDALEWLLRHDAAQMAVLSVDWAQVCQTFPVGSRPALLSLLCPAGAERPHHVEAGGEGGVGARAQFLALGPEEQEIWVQSYLRSVVADVLHLDPPSVDIQQPLNTMGLDSLMAIEMKNRIESGLRVTLPLVRLLEGPDLVQLAAAVLAELQPQPEMEGDRLTELLRRVEQLSEEEASALLARERQQKENGVVK